MSNTILARAPAPTLLAGSSGVLAVAPKPTLLMGSNGVVARAPAPSLVASVISGDYISFSGQAPRPALVASGVSGNVITFSGQAPRPYLEINFNSFTGTAPSPLLVATVLSGTVASVVARAPAPVLLVTLANSAVIAVAGRAPAPRLSSILLAGNVLSVVAVAPAPVYVIGSGASIIGIAPSPRLFASVATGNIASVFGFARAPRLLASGFSGNYASFNGHAAAPTLVVGIYQNGVLSFSGVAPAPRLDARAYAALVENFRTWVLNMKNKALTEYTALTFNSFAEFQGRVLAASVDGVFVLGAQAQDNTAPIAAVVRDGAMEYDSSFLKRIPRIYLGHETDGDLLFKMISTEGGPRSYLLPYNGAGLRSRRIPVGKGPKSRYWQWEVDNQNGSDFTISSVALYPKPVKRRVM